MNLLLGILAQAKDITPLPDSNLVNDGLLYVILAYGVAWLFIFAYLFSIHRRQVALKREIEILKEEEALDRQEKISGGNSSGDTGVEGAGNVQGGPVKAGNRPESV